ncbi:hypothetical protein CVD28_00250 [Bacillus sp. M6-12]|uniref:hypothetical protein n=1 Tax=Bacillus sp. M6-12 TaxID=2054166 RepID=UPI000C760DC5|nr:hypothetical protein [Bacillus sp. M6-12]PLS18866.1 hypothetical protein CVD28_00250 [Bacillus sp. M6-12]
MPFYKVTLSSREKMTLTEKKKYIDSMYREEPKYGTNQKRNQGFLTKFNNSIGFKPVVSTVTHNNTVISQTVESPEEYLPPQDILMEHFHTPLNSNEIISFYLEDKKMVHPNPQFSYEGKMVSQKWNAFLQKVFPQLLVTTEIVEEIPKLSLKEFTLQYFYRNLNPEVNYTLEFRSKELLDKDEMREILSVIQDLSNDKITIGQQYCKTCAGYSDGKEPYHIEIVYLTFYGRDEEEKTYEEYGEGIYKLA